MAWSYNPLWYLLIEKGIKQSQLRSMVGISSNAMAHINQNMPVTMEVLGRICQTLDCKIQDIVEYIPD
jgi:DNA (cytosine-5)-methyltransferase 1